MPAAGSAERAERVERAGREVERILYCISGAWTDAWYDDPVAWWEWCCTFKDWSVDEWLAFYRTWRRGTPADRERLMVETGLRFFDWSRVPGGSTSGSTRAAAKVLADELARLPATADVTLIGHSKGGHAVKCLLAMAVESADERCAETAIEAGKATRQGRGALPARAILIDAPLDWLREVVAGLLGLGIVPCAFRADRCPIPCVTINNWLDPSGGRFRGRRNYQTFIWQDHLSPYPPHGMKGFLAGRVLRDLGVAGAEGPGQPAGRRGEVAADGRGEWLAASQVRGASGASGARGLDGGSER